MEPSSKFLATKLCQSIAGVLRSQDPVLRHELRSYGGDRIFLVIPDNSILACHCNQFSVYGEICLKEPTCAFVGQKLCTSSICRLFAQKSLCWCKDALLATFDMRSNGSCIGLCSFSTLSLLTLVLQKKLCLSFLFLLEQLLPQLYYPSSV
eukprot:XP_001710296.1 Hypothetical protein GL50803_38040 [Giardia lamblia ATCC 50803]